MPVTHQHEHLDATAESGRRSVGVDQVDVRDVDPDAALCWHGAPRGRADPGGRSAGAPYSTDVTEPAAAELPDDPRMPPTGADGALALEDGWWPRPPRPPRSLHLRTEPSFRLGVGARALEPDAWLRPRPVDAVLLGWKARLIEAEGNRVVAAVAGSRDACHEALAAVMAVPGVPGPAERDAERDVTAGARTAIDAAGRMVAEDLCVLDVRSGTPVLVAASLAMPNRWRLHDKLGRPLLDVHDPVPGYAADIGAATDALITRLPAGRIVARTNWGVMDHPALFQPVARPAPPLAPGAAPDVVLGRLWMRVEYQTLRALPASGGVLFTIRTAQERLVEALHREPARAAALHDALRELPPAMLDYKGIARHLPTLLRALSTWTPPPPRPPEQQVR